MSKIFHWKHLLVSVLCIFMSSNLLQAQQVLIKESNIVRQVENTVPTNNWVGYFRTGTPQSALQFINGPAVPPRGCGSVQLTTGTGSEKVTLFNYDHVAKPLGAINEISYATYRSAVVDPAQVASMNVQIDFNGPVTGGFSTLVFEPIYNPTQGPIINGTWQNWDGKSGIWWSTRLINGQPAGAALADMRTWSQIVANNPAATIIAVGVNQGSGNGGLTTSVDDFRFDNNIYNFEFQDNTVTNTNTGRTYCTIQSAINDPLTAPGNIINVGAGTYNENIVVNKSLTIRGPNNLISPNGGARVPEATITGGLSVDNSASRTIVIEGLSFQGVTSPMVYNSGAGTIAADFTFRKNIVNNSSGQLAVDLGNPTNSAIVVVDDNSFVNMSGNAIQLNGGTGMLNATVTKNSIAGTGTAGINTNGISTSTFDGNTISNTGQQGIQVAGTASNVTISNNVITNANTTNAADRGGIRLRGGSLTGFVNVTNNIISGSNNGIALPAPDDITGKSINVNNNNLSGNTKSINHFGTGNLNATCNWYGSTNSAAVASKISGSVTYIPYLTSGGDAAGVGFQPTGTCNGSNVLTITCPADQTVMPTTLAGTVVNYLMPSVLYNCPGVAAPVLTAGLASGLTFPIGTTTVTYQVTDLCGNTASCSFTVTVIDPYCDNQKKKAYVCHNGNTICVSVNAVQAHLNHGDYLGQCTTSLRSIVIEEPVTDEFRVNVYPNPSAGAFRIQVISNSMEPVSVKVMDLSGKVLTVNSNVIKGAIVLGNELRPGTYIAEVIQGSSRQVIKLVKVN